jgi:hypothetical protein
MKQSDTFRGFTRKTAKPVREAGLKLIRKKCNCSDLCFDYRNISSEKFEKELAFLTQIAA